MFNVVLFSGELCHDEIDFALPGLIPVEIPRSFRTTLRRAGRLGYGWTWPWDMVLRSVDDGFLFEVDAGALIERYPNPVSTNVSEQSALRRQGPLLALTRANGYVHYFVAEDTVSSRGALVGAIEDAHGNRLRFENFDGLVRELRDADGRVLQFSYDTHRRLVSIQLLGGVPDQPARLITYEYSAGGDLTRVVNRCGDGTSYEYHDHLLVSLRTPTGGTYHAQYDSARRCIRRWRGDGRLATTFDYDDLRRQVLVTDALGNAELVSLGERGEIQKEVAPDGSIKIYSHDANGGLLSVSAAGADTILVTETNGTTRKVTMADGSGVTITQTIDLVTGARELRNSCGGVWTTVHDAKDQPIEERLPSGATTRYDYEPNGSLRAYTDPNGNTIRVTYAEGGRMALVGDDVGEVARQRWDEEGRLVEYVDPLMNPLRYRYDPLGRVTGVVQPTGGEFEFRFNSGGDRVEVVDPTGAVTRYRYSPYGELVSQIGPEGGEIQWEYDALARVVAIRNQANEEMRFEYDARGRIVSQSFFDRRIERYRYDEGDQLIAIEEADGALSQLERDPAGRILAVRKAGPSIEQVTYDDAGRAIEMANGDVVLRYDYDPGHRVTREDQDGVVMERQYDVSGECTVLDVAGLGRRRYEYDQRRRLTRLVDFDGTDIALDYDLHDRLASVRVEGIEIRHEYARLGRRATTRAVVGAEVFQVSYEHDLMGRVVKRRVPGRDDVEFEYDRDGRLAGHRRGVTRFRHNYTPTGDLLEGIDGRPLRYGPGSRLESSGDMSLVHDARGRLVMRDGVGARMQFAYDEFDRLVGVNSSEAGTTQFVYDIEGRLLRKKSEAGETRYVWDDDTMIAEISEQGNISSFVSVPADLGPIWISTPSIRGAVVSDLNAYPIAWIRPDGSRLDDEPDPWGRTQVWSGAASRQPLRMAGQYDAREIGLYYNRHRFYDPDSGRYLTPDPIGINGGLNAYAYAADPVNMVDPLGLTITTLNPGQKPQVRKKECPPNPGEPKPRTGPAPQSSACPASRGASIHNDCIKQMEKEAQAAGKETRTDAVMSHGKNKQNRPDLTMFDSLNEANSSVFCEWDYSPARRARNHIRDICRNHPGATIYLIKLPQTSRFSSGRPGKSTPKKLGNITRPSATNPAAGPSPQDCGIDVIKTDMGI